MSCIHLSSGGGRELGVVLAVCLASFGFFFLLDDADFSAPVLQYLPSANATLSVPLRDHTPPHAVNNPDLVNICPVGVRRKHLNKMCQELSENTDRSVAMNIITDSSRKLLYCEVSKVACTKVKTLWELANTDWKSISPVAAHSLDKLKAAGLKYSHSFKLDDVTKAYTKFIVVRHPIDRLISAYKNLLHFNGNGPVHATKPLIKMFHLEKQGIQGLTFSMFLQAIVDEKFSYYNDRHWKPYSSTCNPCYVDYDYIIRTETMQNGLEVVEILNMLNYSLSVMKNVVNPGKDSVRLSGDRVRDRTHSSGVGHFQVKGKYDAWLRDVSESVLKEVYHRYRQDMLLFGYTLDFACGINHNGQTCC